MCHHPEDSLRVSKGSVFREASYCGSWSTVQLLAVMVMQTHNNHKGRVQRQHSVKPKEREGGKRGEIIWIRFYMAKYRNVMKHNAQCNVEFKQGVAEQKN